MLAAEISRVSRYCDSIVQALPLPHNPEKILDDVVAKEKKIAATLDALPDVSDDVKACSVVLLVGNINHDLDIQNTLQQLHPKLTRRSRVLLVGFNPYLRWLYLILNKLGMRRASDPSTFVTRVALRNIARLAGFELVRERPVCPFPVPIPLLSDAINRFCSALPLVRWLGFGFVAILRPVKKSDPLPSLSIIVPARNEKGNIEAIFSRTPVVAPQTEIIMVEGNSSDGTWEEIQRVYPKFTQKFPIKVLKQTGRGKGDAVHLALANTSNDLVVILDADLSVEPELLPRFYDAYCLGLGDFINGNRLVYPIEGQAMRFLNKLGNIFFAKALSSVLDTNLGDTLCGSKLVALNDIRRFEQWRHDFGDFDPFGDFELLFPAATLGLGVVDLPIHYRDRVYGQTNISRFRHGLMLLRMTIIGFLRIKMSDSA